GGIVASCHVLELQDRGTPHIHYCLWTNDNIDTMIENGVVWTAAVVPCPILQISELDHDSSNTPVPLVLCFQGWSPWMSI
ncbi:hypothetical protein K457DRAFT_81082, partial [Linnemannia elongata AG-77]